VIEVRAAIQAPQSVWPHQYWFCHQVVVMRQLTDCERYTSLVVNSYVTMGFLFSTLLLSKLLVEGFTSLVW